jgi:hypothetical protein
MHRLRRDAAAQARRLLRVLLLWLAALPAQTGRAFGPPRRGIPPCGMTRARTDSGRLWIVALVWMGTACILNVRCCGRTHCRYTGPFYLAMVAPVLVAASGIVSVDFYGWQVLAILILAGSKIIGAPPSGPGGNSHRTERHEVVLSALARTFPVPGPQPHAAPFHRLQAR